MNDRTPRDGPPPGVSLVAMLVLALPACGDSPSAPGDAELCATATGCADRLEVTPRRYLVHYRSFDLETGAEAVTRGLVIVHGTGRDAHNYFETGIAAAVARGVLGTTVVVAPRFQTLDDGPAADEPYWTSGGWKRGHLSSTDGPDPRISSFAALDTIVRRLSDPARFPAMEEIVVAGHSAGGQVAHRYAAGGAGPRHGVPVRYVVANPSTYLFLRDERPDPDGEGFAVPDRAACPGYDTWHYGLAGLNSYMSRLGEPAIVANLVDRDVTVMVGDRDTGSAQLDVSCGADLQGEHRYARGLNLMAYMDAFFVGHGHTGVVVPGVAHSSRGMFTSAPGLQALFR